MDETTIDERKLVRGDVVRIKQEWLDPGESSARLYVVLEDRGFGHVLVQPMGTNLLLPPTYEYNASWLHYIFSIPKDPDKEVPSNT